MKVLSGSITVKTLSGGGMEPSIEFTLDGNAKIPALPRQCVTEERVAQSIENAVNSKWNVLRKWRKSHSPHTSLSSCADTDSQLFGQPLSKICPVDGTLPKPIKEILVLLRKKGPSTEGVFRKTGNSKNLKVIREQLSSGTDVDMDALPVVLLVGLLKSFLKELPGSLLVSDLYETWMEALETKDVHQLKRVVEKLPGPNTLLLRNILCVLHHIIESQDTNKMDTKNLAVCIAPTLLQKDSEVLDVHTVEKVTELTEFLIEHCCAIFGEDILSLLGVPDEDNLDTVSSQQHDSAYDSTDPDAEGDSMGSTQGEAEEEGEKGGSFPSLLSVPAHLPGTFHTNKHFSRRQSEPIIFNSAEKLSLIGQARSHDDFSGEGRDFEEQSLKKQISDDSFLLSGRRGAGNRPTVTLSLPKLGDPSCLSSCSLDSAASNASEGSVFTSSPLGSPSCLRRAQSTRHAPLSVRSRAEPPVAGTAEAVKRCAQSMRVVRTKSLGAANPLRGSKKCDVQKDKSFPCGTLQEDFQSEAAAPAWPLRQRRPLSAVDVFKQVDCWQPSRPPSYEQALQNAAQPAPPHYGSMTVSAATATLSRKSRPASMNANFQYPCTVGQYKDCLPLATDIGNVISGQQHSVQFRQRTMSESRPKAHHENVSRRCSQSVFEEYSYAKESYV